MLLRSRSHALASQSRRSRISRIGALCVLSLLVLSTTGCFGTFPLTRTVYKVNQDVSEVEFHQTLAYWAMIITLVYPGAALSDMIVMNSIEFWKPEPASWEAAGAFVPAAADRYESIELEPAVPETIDAPSGPVFEDAPIPIAPVMMDAPGIDAPIAPGRPSIPLPLPPLSPVFEEPTSSNSPRTLSRSDGPGMNY